VRIERRYLTGFAFPAEVNSNQHEEIDYARAQRDLQHDVPTRREKHSIQFAVTGVGALFGVLRYPVAFFLSTDQTTSSNSR
jgi:hypothetical protein